MTNRKGRGRPNSPAFVTSWGETIHGACRTTDHRIRPIGKPKPAYSLNDERRAVFKMKRYLASLTADERDYVSLADMNQHPAWVSLADADRIVAKYPFGKIDHETIADKLPHVTDLFIEHFRELIYRDPKQAALRLRVEHLQHYPTVPDKPACTLEELGTYWADNVRNQHGKRLHAKHLQNTARFWDEFVAVVGVTYARDITGYHVQRYVDKVMAAFDAGKSPSYVRSRFTAIKSIIGYPMKRTETTDTDRAEARRVLDLCAAMRPPAQTTTPNPISTEHFTALLAGADLRETAVLLLGLNCAMHIGEVAATRHIELDLDAGTFVGTRSKNAQPRVAHLWQRTVDAVRAYSATVKRKSPYLFVSQRGLKPTGETLRQRIVAIRKKAGLPNTVTFEGLRDAAYGAAEQVDAHHAKFLAGHKTGMSDKYVLRQATNAKVVACCNAIEDHFFGDNDNA